MISAAPLDPAFAAMLADPRVDLRPPADALSIQAYRTRLDAPLAALTGPPIRSVDQARTEGGIDLRFFRPATATDAQILFLHGGGFVAGSLDTHDALCRSLAIASDATVVAVDYRLAPEAPFPAALDDCRAALRYLIDRRPADTAWMAVCGDSAGAHLATMLAIDAASADIRLDALGLFYPVVAPACDTASWQQLGTGHLLTRTWMRWAWSVYRGDTTDETTLDLLRRDLAGVAPVHIITAAFDPLRDEGEALAVRIRRAGGRATLSRFEGMIHGFASLPMLTPAADAAIVQMAKALSVNSSVD